MAIEYIDFKNYRKKLYNKMLKACMNAPEMYRVALKGGPRVE